MLEVLYRSQGARLCEYRRDDALLETIALLSYHAEGQAAEDGSIQADGAGRIYRICGEVLRSEPLILSTMSSRREAPVQEFPSFPEAALLRLPLPADLSSLREKRLIILENAFELRSNARKAVEVLSTLRSEVGYLPLIYTPGLADPSNLALLAYMGVDIVDDLYPCIRAGEGVRVSDAGELLPPLEPEPADLREENRQAMRRELELVQHYVRRGRLRELVDSRAVSSPWSVAVLRLYDQLCYELVEERCPVAGERMACNSTQSLQRPEVLRFRRKVASEYQPPEHKRVLVLLPCSARKPYSLSRTHRLFNSAIRTGDHDTLVHEVIITSPLGIVPRELETFYPANAYDIPVTGEWKLEEKEFIRGMLEGLLSSHSYDVVISHLGPGHEFLDGLVEMEDTVVGDPTSPASLRNLESALRQACADMPRESYQTDRINTIRSIAAFQFGEASEALLEGAQVTGRYPFWKIIADKQQLGMLTGERGMISLTLDGAERLKNAGGATVEIEDFELRGSLFAVGVREADSSIRIGDDVAICHEGELRGVGVALMPGSDMPLLKRGVAVKVRHRVR